MQTTSGCRKKITLWGWYELDYKTGKHKLDVSPIHEHEHPCSHPGHRSLHHLPLRSFVSASISFTTTDFLDTLRILRHHPQDVHMCLSSLWSPLLLRLSCLAPLLPSILKNLSSQLFLPWIIPMFSTSLPYFAFPCTFPFLHILLLHLICLSSTSRTRAEFFFLLTSMAPAICEVPGTWWGPDSYLWNELIHTKALNKMLAWQIQQHIKKYSMTQLGFSQGCKFNLKLKKILKWQIKRKT